MSQVHPSSKTPSLASIFRLLPTFVVLVALAGIGFWGHHTGWKIPKLSELTGSSAALNSKWCDAHNVLDAECIECQTSLLPEVADYGWCSEHGLDPCPLCHPEVIQLATTPQIPDSELERVSMALRLRARPENNAGCSYNAKRVQFASLAAMRKAGIDVEPVERQRIVESIEANGEITYNQTRLARISSRVQGSVWRVEKNVGDYVHRGDLLALIEAADVGRAKAEFLDALANVGFQEKTVARLKPLAEEQIIPGSRFLEAETALQQAQIKLGQSQQTLVNLGFRLSVQGIRALPATEQAETMQFLGLPDDIRQGLDATTTTSNLLPIIAPQEGVVIQREVVAGEVVGTQQVLFQLADTSRMWLVFNVAMEDARFLKVGQRVQFQPDGSSEQVQAELNWISTDVDRETRTIAVRAELENPDSRYRSETFGLGKIVLREDAEAIVVPSGAVQWDGNCHVVFVRDKDYFDESKPKIFHTRSVRPGVKQNGFTEIFAGVWPGEVVVTSGSSVLRSQILKSNLGVGCTCGH